MESSMTPPEETAALERVLAACPFCQAEVELCRSHVVGEGDYIRHKPKVGGNNCGMDGFSSFNIDGDLAEAWNTRTSDPDLARRAAEKERAALSSMVRELADELEAELAARYAGMLPQMAQRLARDMDTVVRARALITPIAEGR